MHQSWIHRLFWGLILISCGTIFLLDQIGVLTMDIGDVFSTFWPVILILVGLQGLLLQSKGGLWWNPIVILLGCYFLGHNLGWIHADLGEVIGRLWPLVIIIAGISLVFRGARGGSHSKQRRQEEDGWNSVTPPMPPTPPTPPSMPSGPPPAPQPYDSPSAFSQPTGAQQEWKGTSDSSGSEQKWKDTTNSSGTWQGWEETSRPSWERKAEHYREKAERYREKAERKMEKVIRHGERHFTDWKHYHRPPGHTMRGNRVDHSRFIGDVHIGQEIWELTPMSISHFIGDTTLDLTRAQIPFGETRIYISSFIGDVKAFVPNDPTIGFRVMSSCLIGDVKVMEQSRGGVFNQISVETPLFEDAEKQVVLIVSSFIGDVRITKVG